jgi:hypothetical protein
MLQLALKDPTILKKATIPLSTLSKYKMVRTKPSSPKKPTTPRIPK